MVERRLIALFLVSLGVWLQWSLGVALIVAGVGVAASGVDPRSVSTRTLARARGISTRVRPSAAAMPRRTAAIVMVCLAAVLLPAAALSVLGVWPALGVLGVIFLVDGHLLGWE